MPTSRARHTITETDTVAHALDEAQRRWPEDRDARSRLLARLVEEGRRALAEQRAAEADNRREAIRRTRGALSGCYPDGYLESLRHDWPA
jgi:hypothetical protein